jgi:hypothetical protein
MVSRLVDLLWESVDEEQKLLSSGLAEIVYEDSDIKMVQIKSFTAYQYYSQNQFPVLNDKKWFDSYIDYTPLWLIQFKLSGQIWKFWFPVGHMMPKLVDSNGTKINIMQYLRTFDSINHSQVASGKFDPFLKVFLAYEGMAIHQIFDPSISLQLFVVNRKGTDIFYIRHPSPLVQFAAIKQNPNAIKFIKPEDLAPSLKSAGSDTLNESLEFTNRDEELISSGQAEIVWESATRHCIKLNSTEAIRYYCGFDPNFARYNKYKVPSIYAFLDDDDESFGFVWGTGLLQTGRKFLSIRDMQNIPIVFDSLMHKIPNLPVPVLELFLRVFPALIEHVPNSSINLQLFNS